MAYLIFLVMVPVVLSVLVRFKLHCDAAEFFSLEVNRIVNDGSPISILVPVRGLDQGAKTNFLSLIEQDYSSPFEVVFAVEDSTDAAVPLIQELIESYPTSQIKLIFSAGSPGSGKIQNQIAAVHICQYDIWVLIDSDVQLAPDFLQSQAAWIAEKPEVGLAYAPPIGFGSKNWVAAIHNIGVSTSLLNYCRAAMQDRLNAAVGSCIVTRRDVIDAIGGFELIANQVVGLDVSLGQAIVEANYKIELLQQPARIRHEHDTVTRYWWQVHRWLATINHYFPRFWLVGILLGVPLLWALFFMALAVWIGHFQVFGGFLIAGVICFEMISAGVINATISKDQALWKYLWVAPLGQLITFPLLLLCRTSRQVKWRGRWISLESAN